MGAVSVRACLHLIEYPHCRKHESRLGPVGNCGDFGTGSDTTSARGRWTSTRPPERAACALSVSWDTFSSNTRGRNHEGPGLHKCNKAAKRIAYEELLRRARMAPLSSLDRVTSYHYESGLDAPSMTSLSPTRERSWEILSRMSVGSRMVMGTTLRI